jgi:hypothetical protein
MRIVVLGEATAIYTGVMDESSSQYSVIITSGTAVAVDVTAYCSLLTDYNFQRRPP